MRIWQPFTQMQTASAPLKVRSASGAMLILEDGSHVLDCIASWWTNVHGHSHPAIAEAIYKQALSLEHVMLAGFTHEPIERLTACLETMLPKHLTSIFYSDNGSTAIETGMKMALQYWHNLRQPEKCRFLAFQGGYHGDTVGAMSVAERSVFTKPFEPVLFATPLVPFAETWEGDGDVQTKEAAALAWLDSYLDQNGRHIAAMLLEPLVQGASGMRMCRPEFLRAVHAKLAEHGILVIYDEVMTGFGRTGALLACQKAGTQPDILCLAKGLSGGALPLAATVTTEAIFQAFCDEDVSKALLHGHTYTGNPIVCAAALASCQMLCENPAYEKLESWHRDLAALLPHDKIERLRFCGGICAFNYKTEEATYGSGLSLDLKREFLSRGFLIRPIGSCIYLSPSYCISKDELRSAYLAIAQVLEQPQLATTGSSSLL